MIHRLVHSLVLVFTLVLCGCPSPNAGSASHDSKDSGDSNNRRPKLLSLLFTDPVTFSTTPEPVALGSARNESVSFAIEVDHLSGVDPRTAPVLRMQPLRLGTGASAEDRIEPAQFEAYQLLFMPVDLNRAAFVRHTGIEEASLRSLPRALLPIPVDHARINLAGLRNPDQPRNPAGRAITGSTRPLMLWFDVNVPAMAKAGDYQTTFEVLQRNTVVSTLVVKLHVNDFVLPTERNLQMVGQLDWSSLRRLYPAIFETADPLLLKRGDPQTAQAIEVLDQLVKLGQQHRAEVVIPALKPVVKWPPGQPPQVSWEDFDSVVMPWLTGKAFADGVPLGYWPLPEAAALRNFALPTRAQYWSAAASHFAGQNLLKSSPIIIQKEAPGALARADWPRLSGEAAQLLKVNADVRINLPLADDEVQFQDAQNPGMVDAGSAPRLITAAPGLVYREPAVPWPGGAGEPGRWLAADQPGLVPFAGAGGDERDVRLWASLAFLRRAELVQWPNTLPNYDNPDQAIDPDDVIWFYPGQWFGVQEPVPTVHLKWIRRAQQDYEYLYLARARGEWSRTFVIARLITKPVLIPLAQAVDPAYALLCGSTDLGSWQQAKQLLAESILLRPPGGEIDRAKDTDLNGRALQWIVPHERPLMMARQTSWGWDANQSEGPLVDLRMGIDLYNAADRRLIGQLQWAVGEGIWPSGWLISPRAMVINPASAINTYHVQRLNMDIAIRLDELVNGPRKTVQWSFKDEATSHVSPLEAVVPLAICDHRGNGPLRIDGDLSDWSQADSIQNGPLVRMLNGPSVQAQAIQNASTPSQIYSGWGNDRFYLAFAVHGCQANPGIAQTNFVDYPLGRAWGEDLVETLLQPLYADGTAGPVLHMVAKPRGGWVVERKADSRDAPTRWQSAAGEAILYGATLDPSNGSDVIWRGEIAVPWDAINDPKHSAMHPMLMRFNFSQHKNATGESASWAGPVDSGRDDQFTGLLYLRDPQNPNRKAE